MAKMVYIPRPNFDIMIASAEGVRDRFLRQFKREPELQKAAIDRLKRLDSETVEQVVWAIGNKSWTHPHCCSCEQYVEVAISFPNEGGCVVCERCLTAAIQAIQELAK